MSLPQVIIDVGLISPLIGDVFTINDPLRGVIGSVPIGGDVWTDITESARSWSVKIGAGRADSPTLRYEAGTATVVLNDGDRRFDAENLAGPYVAGGVSLVRPMVRVRIRVVWDGVTYPIFFGYADDWQPDYQGNEWTYVTLTATDGSKILADDDRLESAPTGAGQLSGARINLILDTANWPAEDREIAAGDTTLQATDLSGNALGELQLVQDTELGEFYFDRLGRARFRNRQAMTTYERSTTPQAVFGDAGYTTPPFWDFEDGLVPFTPTGCTVIASQMFVHDGQYAMRMTVVGSPVTAYARSNDAFPAAEGRRYTASMWVYHPTGGTVVAAIDWYFDLVDPLDYISTSSTSQVVTAATWTRITVTGTAPATTVSARPGPTMSASPPTGSQLYTDEIRLVDLDAELPYADVKPSVGDEGLANYVQASRAGGTEQVVQDAASMTLNLKKTYTRNDLLMETDAEALSWASAQLYQWSQRTYRFARIEFNTPALDIEDALWPQLLAREFGDRITVRRRPKGGGAVIERDCFIRGAEFESDGAFFRTAFVLQDASRYSFFVIGDPLLGRVGENAISY